MGLMNRTFVILLGVLATVLSSFIGFVAIPEFQLAELGPVTLDDGTTRPIEPFGEVKQGRGVYIGLGCIYCHSQQVRPEGFGADIARGWGTRQSLPQDYIFQSPPLLGTMRTGPDLWNIGSRQPSEAWHYLHLYDPELTSPGSLMPKFRFLFERVRRDDRAEKPADALELPEGMASEDVWVVPNDDARALVRYLLSLDHTYPLPPPGGGDGG
jgi:cytochrome c oxidase cbb3-type subunit II